MNNYQETIKELKRNILAQKTIYKFRTFLYSMNKNIRHHCFELCRNYLQNEYHNNNEITVTERDRLENLLHHWQWNEFETNATNWWYILSVNHSHSLSLMTLMHLWIDDVEVFDPEDFETSTLGLS
jgi:hypothetical protein